MLSKRKHNLVDAQVYELVLFNHPNVVVSYTTEDKNVHIIKNARERTRLKVMPVKINVVASRVQKVQVKIQRARWQQYIKY